ncbi:HAD family hydrolase [Gryllotalpicola protaetiae]|uniref:HAD family hydrolase n=1 Tax=Gryllotalpicola protaetiae TaxID=2419771 RepID=A0A387BW87_9MICO|nr:HAD family hydrolase [Gryllotalpicola protaetiae]AYG05410.1 HAD family hydrolase [Gryllotalpicola protaetiae]
MTPPEVVLFDLDATLFDHPGAFRRGILSHVAALGAPYDALAADEIVGAWQVAEDLHFDRYLAGELDYEGQRRARVRDFVERFGGGVLSDDEALDWFRGYYTAYRDAWSAYPEVNDALDALEAAVPGVRFGIITNGELALQARKVEKIGVAPRMEHVIASAEFGAAKPDPRIFAHAVGRFGVSPAAAVYVGDRIRVDALGAAAAGLAGVWIDRDARGWGDYEEEAAAAGIRRIMSLTDLPVALTT